MDNNMSADDEMLLAAVHQFENGNNAPTTTSVCSKNSQSASDDDSIRTTPIKKLRLDCDVDTTPEKNRFSPTIISLPAEILREIFTWMPIRDLLLITNLVCPRFNDIIKDENFLRYKKLYYQYRAKQENALNVVKADIVTPIEKSLFQPNKSLAAIVWSNSISEFRVVLPKEVSLFMDRLEKLSNFCAVKSFLARNVLSESFLNEPTIWNYICGFVVLCEDVYSISTLLRLLCTSPRIFCQSWIVEFFYCVLLHLAVVNDKIDIAHRLHYNLYYALYLFENSDGNLFSESAEKSVSGFLTSEQQHVVNYTLRVNDCVKVVAFAGTGKTTCLVEYVKRHRNKKFLIIFYNKSTKEDASNRFSSNALCNTIHSIAYNATDVKRIFGHKFRSNVYNSDIPSGFTVTGLSSVTSPALVRATLLNYLASPDEDLDERHAPDSYRAKMENSAAIALAAIEGFFENQVYVPAYEVVELTFEQKQQLAEYGLTLWNKMKNPKDNFPMVHDGYLKLFQLSKPNFKKLFPGVDIIMVDEAQDCNPVTLDIIKRQSHPKIVVGDDCQQIYGFRGSVNALKSFDCTKTFYLTQSFRFGPEIAYFAYSVLNKVKKEGRKILVGINKKCVIDGEKIANKPVVIICRSNVQIFIECAAIAKLQNAKLFIMGNLETLNLDLLQDLALYLQRNRSPNVQPTTKVGKFYWNKFRTLEELEKHAEKTLEWILVKMIFIVKKYNSELLALIEKIKICQVTNMAAADYVVTTVHKAKGLEFENVRLAPDFAELCNSDGTLTNNNNVNDPNGDDEFNLLYVALTRAKSSLVINEQLLKVLVFLCKDGFQCLKLGRKLPDSVKSATTLKCVFCNETLDNSIVGQHSSDLHLFRDTICLFVGNNALVWAKNGLQCEDCFFALNLDAFEMLQQNKLKLYDAHDMLVKGIDLNGFRNISVQYAPFLKNFR